MNPQIILIVLVIAAIATIILYVRGSILMKRRHKEFVNKKIEENKSKTSTIEEKAVEMALAIPANSWKTAPDGFWAIHLEKKFEIKWLGVKAGGILLIDGHIFSRNNKLMNDKMIGIIGLYIGVSLKKAFVVVKDEIETRRKIINELTQQQVSHE